MPLNTKIVSFAAVILFSSTIHAVFAQSDFRDATVTLASGDVIKGKVHYGKSLRKSNFIRIRKAGKVEHINIHNIRHLSFRDYGMYTPVIGNADTLVMMETLLQGEVALYRNRKQYYILKDSLTYLNNEKTVVEFRGKTTYYKSKRYLSTLDTLCSDCADADLKPVASRLLLRPLMKVVQRYAACINKPTVAVYPKATLEIMPYVALENYTLASGYLKRTISSAGAGTTYGVSFLIGTRQFRDLNLRVDLSYVDATVYKVYVRTVPPPQFAPIGTYPRERQMHFAASFSGVNLPIGLQYYLKRNLLGIYLAGGCNIRFLSDRTFIAQGYFVNRDVAIPTFQPTKENTFKMTTVAGPPGDLWIAIGADYRIAGPLRFAAELKGNRSPYNVASFFNDTYEEEKGTVSRFLFKNTSIQIGLRCKLR